MSSIRNKGKIIKIALTLIFSALIILLFIFAQFTSLGYRATVPLRNFAKVEHGVYIHKNYANSEEAVLILQEARARVEEFFGEIKSSPMIILCDDKKTISKLGGDHDTSTAVFFRAYSYIVLSSDYLNVDIAAHEMTHAEVHSRIFNSKLSNKAMIPIWFDEGLALQNDYRDNYNEAAWVKATNNGEKITEFDIIETPDKFYAGESEDRRYRFIISKHEVSKWIEVNGKENLLNLLDKVNQGVPFNGMYNKPSDSGA